MGILFSDGFDSYAATADLTKKWLTANSPWVWSATGGRNGGGCIQAATTGGGIIRPISTGLSTNFLVCFAFWFKASAAPAAVGVLLQMRKSALAAVEGALRVTTAGKMSLITNGGALMATGSVNVCDGNWHWCELYYNDGGGVLNKLYVDGLAEWNGLFSTDSGPVIVDEFELTSITGITVSIDDFVVWDASTGSPQPSDLPLGPRLFLTVRPQADSAVSFATTTSGGGSHWDQVDEVNADGDATYVESSSSGDQDLYDFAAMGISPVNITAVVANAYVENPNAGTINFRQVAESSSTVLDGASVQAPSSYRTVQQPFPVDPNTSAAWASASAVDSATFGIGIP